MKNIKSAVTLKSMYMLRCIARKEFKDILREAIKSVMLKNRIVCAS